MSEPDLTWLTNSSVEDYEKYAGKCIAVLNGKVVGVGTTVVEAAEEAEKSHPGGNYVLEKVEADTERL